MILLLGGKVTRMLWNKASPKRFQCHRTSANYKRDVRHTQRCLKRHIYDIMPGKMSKSNTIFNDDNK